MTPEAEKQLNELLRIEGLPRRASFLPSEVCALLRISDRQFRRMVSEHDLWPDGTQKQPWTIGSVKLSGHHRVKFTELADWLERNTTYERANSLDAAREPDVKPASVKRAPEKADRAPAAACEKPVQRRFWE